MYNFFIFFSFLLVHLKINRQSTARPLIEVFTTLLVHRGRMLAPVEQTDWRKDAASEETTHQHVQKEMLWEGTVKQSLRRPLLSGLQITVHREFDCGKFASSLLGHLHNLIIKTTKQSSWRVKKIAGRKIGIEQKKKNQMNQHIKKKKNQAKRWSSFARSHARPAQARCWPQSRHHRILTRRQSSHEDALMKLRKKDCVEVEPC